MTIIRIGLDTSKHLFQVHGVDDAEEPGLRRHVRRGEMETFFGKLAPARIGLEACGASHHWARVLRGLGHEVVLPPAQYVRPGACPGEGRGQARQERRDRRVGLQPTGLTRGGVSREAMSRGPSAHGLDPWAGMRFAPVKSAEQQAALMLLKARDLLVKQRTMLINAIRGHAAEFGVVAAKGPLKVAELPRRAHAEEAGVPELALGMPSLLSGQLDALDLKLKALESQLLALHKHNPVSRCLATQPGIGPIGAISFALKVSDPQGFRSGRHFAAWLGLTPKENPTGGRHRPGRISRRGDQGLRRLLVLGATAVIRFATAGKTSSWLMNLLARRPKKLAAPGFRRGRLALANKMARTLWAMMVSGELYRRPRQA